MRDLHDQLAAAARRREPDRQPGFDSLVSGRRRRDRRRAAAASGLATVVLAAAAALAVPGLVGDRPAPDALVPAASPNVPQPAGPASPDPASDPGASTELAGPRELYVLRYADADAYQQNRPAVEDCLALPGAVDARQSSNVPPVASVMVTGGDENAAFQSCVAAIDGVTVELKMERVWEEAPWAVQQISQDRRTVTVRAYGIAAGCTGPGRGTAQETPDGIRLRVQVDVPADQNTTCAASLPMVEVTAELPRPLAQDEPLLGECVPDDQTVEGRQCQTVRSFVTLPPPGGG
jgi:hypothetical protein